ncbi:hypothetical protein D9756_010722 [Leucocoprinus leucothites]|uniref:Uncharacterized protein n=1 Tax=Leucocoprinus leucothites TaxID=201217 RepID=A0A8H5CVT2_9AGAR|nr:hypothetical protein D9756_010722 [Leucoagaricus leucothites]
MPRSHPLKTQRSVILYLNGPAREDIKDETRAEIKKSLRKVWRRLVDDCITDGIKGPICGIITFVLFTAIPTHSLTRVIDSNLEHLSPGEPLVCAPHSTIRLFDKYHTEIATIHAPMPFGHRTHPFYGISARRARDGKDFRRVYDFRMKVAVKYKVRVSLYLSLLFSTDRSTEKG